jgi:hypothetical protein
MLNSASTSAGLSSVGRWFAGSAANAVPLITAKDKRIAGGKRAQGSRLVAIPVPHPLVLPDSNSTSGGICGGFAGRFP